MNKFLKSSTFALLTLLTLTISRPSQAALGAMFGNPALVTAGAYALGGGVAVTGGFIVWAKTTEENSDSVGLTGALVLLTVALPLGILGLGLLEDEQSLSYNALTPADAARIGISEVELESFNAEIDQINALASYVDSELSSMRRPTLQASMYIWKSVKDTISPEAFTAMQKINSQLYK